MNGESVQSGNPFKSVILTKKGKGTRFIVRLPDLTLAESVSY